MRCERKNQYTSSDHPVLTISIPDEKSGQLHSVLPEGRTNINIAKNQQFKQM